MQKFNTTQITSILEKDVYIFRIKEISFSLSIHIKLIQVILEVIIKQQVHHLSEKLIEMIYVMVMIF